MINWLPKEDVGQKICNKLQPAMLTLELFLKGETILALTLVKDSKKSLEELKEIADLPQVRAIIPYKTKKKRG